MGTLTNKHLLTVVMYKAHIIRDLQDLQGLPGTDYSTFKEHVSSQGISRP